MKYGYGDRVQLGVITDDEDLRGTRGTVISAVSAHEYPYGVELDHEVNGNIYMLCLEGELESENEATIRELRQEISDLRMERNQFERAYEDERERVRVADYMRREQEDRAEAAEREAQNVEYVSRIGYEERDNARRERDSRDQRIAELVVKAFGWKERAEGLEFERDAYKNTAEDTERKLVARNAELCGELEDVRTMNRDLIEEHDEMRARAFTAERSLHELKKALRTLSEG